MAIFAQEIALIFYKVAFFFLQNLVVK